MPQCSKCSAFNPDVFRECAICGTPLPPGAGTAHSRPEEVAEQAPAGIADGAQAQQVTYPEPAQAQQVTYPEPAPAAQPYPVPAPVAPPVPPTAYRPYLSENNSGMGPGTPVPPEAARWNWGAFLTTWIWGIANRVWISLLALLPLVGLVMAFVLGAKGSEWAWQHKRWRSVEHFRSVQKTWALVSALVYMLLFVPMILLAIAIPTFLGARERAMERAGTTTVVTGSDGSFQLTLPATWSLEPPGSESDAQLSAGNDRNLMGVAVVREPRIYFAEMTLDVFSEVTRNQLAEQLQGGEIRGPPNLLQIGGHPAIQYEVAGGIEGTMIVYMHTVIETPNSFVQVFAFSAPSRLDANRAVLQQVTASYVEAGSEPTTAA